MENYLPVTWKRTLIIWWALMWRSFLFCVGLGLIIGVITGVIAVLNKVPSEQYAGIMSIAIYILSIPLSIKILKVILEKKFSEFKIVLVPKSQTVITTEEKV